jgi:hypothetical protein
MKTRYRVIPRAFGIYEFGGKTLRSAEIEEVCVENETLSFEDYVECRRFALTSILFHHDSIFTELYQLLHLTGCHVSDWLRHLHGMAPRFSEKLQAIYGQFTHETITELADTRAELERTLKSQPGVVEEYIRGARGNNVLYGSQTRAYLTCLPDLTTAAYRSAAEFLNSAAPGQRICPGYIAELERYAHARKSALLELDRSFTEEFQFDFSALEGDQFGSLPEKATPTSVEFYYDDWQREFFADQIRRYGRDDQGWTKMFSRTPIKKMFRRARRLSPA